MDPKAGQEGQEGTEGTEPAATTVPLAELVKERKARQAMETKLKELETRDQTELQKAQALVKELEPFKARFEKSHEKAKTRLEGMVKKLPKESREKISASLEKLEPDDAIDLIESLDLLKQPPEKTPPVTRSTPQRTIPDGAPKTYGEWKKLPDEERRKYRDIADQLPE